MLKATIIGCKRYYGLTRSEMGLLFDNDYPADLRFAQKYILIMYIKAKKPM